MDPRLLEAAQEGDVGLLNDPIRSNKLILEEVALHGAGHMSLHIACVVGHSNFVRELLKLMPKLVEKVNTNGFSPLHIAAARGDVEIVRKILKVGRPQHLCLVREGREESLSALCRRKWGGRCHASPESIEETTAREETALHLSVKSNWFDSFVVLVGHLKQHKKEQVINWKDKKGDTILHLAATAKSFEAVDFMLSGHTLKREVMEVNALNDSGSTPLDVSSRSDREIKEILTGAGAKHGQSNLASSQIVLVDDDENDHPQLSPRKDSNQGRDLSGDTRSNLLVVAMLIASATYQLVLQPPTFFKKVKIPNKKGFLTAFLSFEESTFTTNFILFLFLSSNTFGFLLSVHVIENLPVKVPLLLSTIMMIVTYLKCTMNVPSISLLEEHHSPLGDVLIGTLGILMPVALLLWTVWMQKKNRTI